MPKITVHGGPSNAATGEGMPEPESPADTKAEGELLTRIRSLLPNLSRAEQRVARVVLDNPTAVTRRSITEVALAANASETTVTQFCQAVGIAGFPQLRTALMKIAANGKPSNAKTKQQSSPTSSPAGSREENFAANMKRRREALELSQEAFAEKMQKLGHPFHQATVYKLENGSRKIQFTEAADIAEILGSSIRVMMMPPAELIERESIQKAERALSSAESQLVYALREYNSQREHLRIALELYQESGLNVIPEGILDEAIADSKRSATAVVEASELRHHILDEGDGNFVLPPEPVGEMTLDQQLKVAEWEVERSEFVARMAKERHDWAMKYLEGLKSRTTDKNDQ